MKKLFKKKSKGSTTGSIAGCEDNSSLSSSPSSPHSPPRDTMSQDRPKTMRRERSSLQTALQRGNTSLARRTDLEMLGKTVSTIHEALCGNNDDERMKLSEVDFNPQGCVWNALLQNSDDESRRQEQQPITVTCCAHDDSCYSIELSPKSNAIGEPLMRSMHVLKDRLQSVLKDAFDHDDDRVPRVCIKLNTAYVPKSVKSRAVDNESGASMKGMSPDSTQVCGVQDSSIENHQVSHGNDKANKSILQIVRDISSDSSSSSSNENDKWDAKVYERKMARQSSKNTAVAAASASAVDTKSGELVLARNEFVPPTSLSTTSLSKRNQFIDKNESTRTLTTADESSDDSNEEKKDNMLYRNDKLSTVTMTRKIKNDDTYNPTDNEIVFKEVNRRSSFDAERRSTTKDILSQTSLANLEPSFHNSGAPLSDSSDDSTLSEDAPTLQTTVNDTQSNTDGESPRHIFNVEEQSDRKEISNEQSTKASNPHLDMHVNTAAQDESSNDWNDEESSCEQAAVTDVRGSFRTRCMKGQLPMSSRSLLKQSKEADDLANELINDDDDKDEIIVGKSCIPRHPSGELRSAAKGILSRASMLEFEGEITPRKANRRISFDDESMPVDSSQKVNLDTSSQPFDSSANQLIFSNKELESKSIPEEGQKDVLTEGQIYLGISMLVYMYSHLRETVRQGLTRVKMEDIDVNSCQSHYNTRREVKYLSKTKTAGSIIRVVIDELDGEDENDADHELLSGEGKDYEKSQTAQFRKWIEDSRVSQLDEETENMIAELKRKVARHRWKRAISAVRLSYKLSGGKRPKFEAPVAAPGCENENRFVDLNQMMSEVVRKQPKYFKEGSIMDNLIESGIEVAWFSDLTQNDVVYGVCCQREEKKVTVVFRGTVNSHNWSMNLKFDTNEYRNPIKVNYPGRKDELSLHSGFALYLMRKRKDTGISKMEEIFDKVDSIGREMAPDGSYNLCITGHSLGGALATLFGFYVAAKPRFSNLKRVNIWTYAAPRVGTNAFFHAYQYLESIGRIRHARFSNTHDIVPLIPFCNFERDDLQFYQHVGMRIQLHNTGRIGKMRLRNALDVTYPLRHDWLSRLRRIFMNNIFANLTTIKGFGNNHTPTEIQRRLLFASHFKEALARGEHFSDTKRNRVKTLDEYYLIRAQMKSFNYPDDKSCDSSREVSSKVRLHRQKLWVLVLVALLSLSWLNYISVILNMGSVWGIFTYPLMPFTALVGFASGVVHSTIHKCTTTVSHLFHIPRLSERQVLFVPKSALPKTVVSDTIEELAKHRASKSVENTLLNARESLNDSAKLAAFYRSSSYLFNISSVVDGRDLIYLREPTKQSLSPPPVKEGVDDAEVEVVEQTDIELSANIHKLTQTVEEKVTALTDKATGVFFDPKLADGLYLAGVGVRKKSIINIYSVGMYSSPSVLAAISGREVDGKVALREAARSFNSSHQTTAFILKMVYKVEAKTVAAAIADSVKPRYSGAVKNVEQLESLISEGIKNKGGYAIKGTILRFDCSSEGVSVSVDNAAQGEVRCESIGGAFVDVFTDDQAVSPKLVESCIDTWVASDLKLIAMQEEEEEVDEAEPQAAAVDMKLADNVSTKALALTDKATGVSFDPQINEDQFLVGVGVRKKSIISIYSVAMYSSPSVLKAISDVSKGQHSEARMALREAARTFDSSQTTSFVLSMVYKADAKTIAAAIADSVKPRYSGPVANIEQLESLISEGVKSKGGYATKGTILTFDCSAKGVSVSVDGNKQGHVSCNSIGRAFVDVFTDNDAVSPKLVESCVETWSESGL